MRQSPLQVVVLTFALTAVFIPSVLLGSSQQEWNAPERWTSAFLGDRTEELPFSFRYDGETSRNFLPQWKRSVQIKELDGGRKGVTWQFSDPTTGLSLRVEAVVYSDFPAVEWVLWFRNDGQFWSPLIEDVRALDADLPMPDSMAAKLFYNRGTNIDAAPLPGRDEFQPAEADLMPGEQRRFEPYGGRPSDTVLPFFNLSGPGSKAGLFFGIGWTGQWSAQFERGNSGDLAVRAGIKRMRASLAPGEEIRTPAVLIMTWQGADRDDGQNQFRRLLLEHYTPVIGGKPIVSPISAGPHAVIRFEHSTEANLLECIRNISSHNIPVDNFWLDAGWYSCPDEPSGWDKTTGTWMPDPVRFPNGLRPVADAAKEHGMDFLVWFEPERVMPNTWLYENHPEWLLSPADLLPERSYQAASNFRLLDFGNPEALAWAEKYFSDFVREQGVTIFRMDSNLHTILYWQNNEPPARVGMRETKHVMGLYDFWDKLVADNPGLKLDICSGTGSRIDFEVMRRAMNLTRADGAWWEPAPDQAKTIGHAPWTPHTGIGTVSDDLYKFRSGMGAMFCANLNWLSTNQTDWERWKPLMATVNELRDVYEGDFYPLTEWSISEEDLAAWMYHRADTGKAIVQVFRRSQAAMPEGYKVRLKGLDAGADYEVKNLDDPENPARMTGAALMEDGLPIDLPQQPQSALFVLEKKNF